MNVIDRKQSQVFFVDGPGGTGKTFLYQALIATLRNRGKIVLATALSGIAATLLLGGRTAHSRFNLPFDVQSNSICNIKKQKDLAKLIRVAAAIIWDEAPYDKQILFRSIRSNTKRYFRLLCSIWWKSYYHGWRFLSSTSSYSKR